MRVGSLKAVMPAGDRSAILAEALIASLRGATQVE
ncbi:hypothetical protein FHR67_001785 [Xanthomonas arboricola]|nr:hypothetical protein [Xanthomonas campestris]